MLNYLVAIIMLMTIPVIYCLFSACQNERRKYRERQVTRAAFERAENLLLQEMIREPTIELNQLNMIPTIIVVDETLNIHPPIEELSNEILMSDSQPTTNIPDDLISSYPTDYLSDPSLYDLPPSYENCPSYDETKYFDYYLDK